MVVEDNDNLREATVDFLASKGHHVTGLPSAEELDDTPTRDLPDLYLVDVNLPGENGFSLAQRIRLAQPHAGIVLLTARGQLSDRLEGYNVGADHYLIKPIDQLELLACINNLGSRLKNVARSPAMPFSLNSQDLVIRGPGGKVALTHAEMQLLSAMIRAAGQKLERWQAMQLVDSKDKGLVPANLEMRISTLRKKLSQCGAPADAIVTIRSFGYALKLKIEII
jgi:DNA-binding response OmpR family regulator